MGYLIIAGYLLLPPVLALWSYHLVKKCKTRSNIVLLTLLSLAGIIVGIYFGFIYEYYTGPSVRSWSFPIPGATLVKEGDEWVDYILVIPVTNMLFIASFFLIPFVAGNYLCRIIPKRHHSPGVKH